MVYARLEETSFRTGAAASAAVLVAAAVVAVTLAGTPGGHQAAAGFTPGPGRRSASGATPPA